MDQFLHVSPPRRGRIENCKLKIENCKLSESPSDQHRQGSNFQFAVCNLQFAILFLLAGCNSKPAAPLPPPPSTTSAAPRPLTLATTTSTQDSGLLDVLLPKFRAATGTDVKVVAVGSGQAMELGRRGDADVLLVHSPDAEAKFVREGFGMHRYPLMVNEFVIVGPPNDLAAIKGTNSAVEALRKIAAAKATFVSRADKSGTHAKEQSLWTRAEIDPQGDWYLKAGAGMAETLRIANEKGAYSLTDRATYLAQRTKLDLQVVVAKDELLLNQYAVLQLNAAKFPDLNHNGAERFSAFLFSNEAQRTIAAFGQDKFGQPLFFIPQAQMADPTARPVVLPADPNQWVIVLTTENTMAKPISDEPLVAVRADGSVTLGNRFPGLRHVEAQLSGEQFASLLRFVANENDFLNFSGDLVRSTIEQAVAKGRPGPATVEQSTTVVRAHANAREHEVKFTNLERAAELFPEIRSLVQLRAVERRLMLLALTLRAGGRETVEGYLKLANDQLNQQFPALAPFVLDDLTTVLEKAPGATEVHFSRPGKQLDTLHRASTWARIERPDQGEPKVSVGSTEK